MPHHGKFCWYELMSSDLDAAQTFYGAVLGWSAKDSGMPGMDYRLLGRDLDVATAGLMPVVEGGPPPMWTGYVCVDDVDAAASAAAAAGATIHRAPMDILGVGRFAILSDPQGAMLAMLQPLPQSPTPPADFYEAAGRVGWHELHAANWQKAWDFYAPLFAWKQGDGVDMGPMGTYQLFGPAELGRDFGGVMNAQSDRPNWRYYFNVEALDPAMERVIAGGGTIEHGPHQVPGGMWIAMCVDPQDARFALTAAAR